MSIKFREITSLVVDPKFLRRTVDELVQIFIGQKIDYVVSVEARGFILGGAIAHQLSTGFIPIRKKGKLPYSTVSVECVEVELEANIDALKLNNKVVLIDDLIATGRTSEAAINLLQKLGAKVVAAGFVFELSEVCGRSKLEALGVSVEVLHRF